MERERAIYRAIELFTVLNMPLRVMALRSILADICTQTQRFEEAAAHVCAALSVAERDDHPLQIKLLETRGDTEVHRDLLLEAIATYEAALVVAQRFGREVVSVRLSLKLSEVYRQQRDLRLADAFLERAVASISTAEADQTTALYALLMFNQGLHYLDAGQFETAQNCLQQVRQSALDAGRIARAEQILSGLERFKPQPRSPFEGVDSEVTESITQKGLLAQDAPNVEVGSDGGARGSSLSVAHEGGTPRPHLEIVTMGKFEARIDGKPVPIPITKSVELLIWLALHGSARREVIIDALWDGANERRHAEYFRFGIRRLRSSLSEHPGIDFNPIPFEADHYRISERFTIQIDAHTLNERFTPANAEEIELCLLSFNGEFMPQLEAEWVQIWRTRCTDNTTALAMSLAEHLYTKLKSPERALKLYEHMIKRDPLDAEAQFAAIQMCQVIGDVWAARRMMQSYESTLLTELGESLPRQFHTLIQSFE